MCSRAFCKSAPVWLACRFLSTLLSASTMPLDVGRLNILNALLHNKGLQITSPPPAKLNGRAAPGNTQQPFSSSEILMLGNESDLTLSLRFRSYLKMHYNEPQFDAIITATQKGFTVFKGLQVPERRKLYWGC